ncbi:hypothetical protein NP493_553g00000 [Ridgeia piscesae]|uniref:Uncharacterized protein n=1 Tax=Ridgeia piscesae TaxID=27915 RepID=A0AAD9NRS9_RIDPI|nr:hypothetical protein NP493_553g00000 [Ridgeia piscesae]
MDEYVRRVFEAIRSDEELETLQPQIGDVLVQQATCVLGMHQAVENLKAKLLKHKQELGSHLVKTYPLRSRIDAWVNEKYMQFEKEFIEQHQWSAHEETMEVCRRQQLDQAYYFVHRDLIFMRDQEPVLRKELSRVRQPNRTFTFETKIWMPSNWVVTRVLYGQTEVVPTVIVNNPAAYTGIVVDPDQPKYFVRKYTSRKTNTRYPFWRWLNYFHRTWAWTWNAMFWLGLVVPWCSPVSLRALFFPYAFMPDLELSQVSGNLCPKTSSLTHTLLSRLRLLWHHVRESRDTFESSADKGFLGKSFSRHINRFWNYVLKGACGSVALVLGLTPLCLTVSTLSLVTAVTAPVWMPLVTGVVHLSAILIYDFDRPGKGNAIFYLFEAIFYRFLLHGCLQPVAAILVHPSQALAAVESRMEQEELRAWRDEVLRVIEQPKKEYQKFVSQCLHPFSAVLCEQGVYRDLVQETKHLCEWLQTKITERQKHLQTGLSPDISARVKVSGRELKVILLQTANMLQEFYPRRVLHRLPQSQDSFWEGRHLEPDDWQGLASQLLAEVFSTAFLTPLEATDTCFRLEVQHLNLSRYIDMLKSAEFRDDLDVVSTIHTPKGDIDVDTPFLEIRIFNPIHDKVAATGLFTLRSRQGWKKPWKRTTIGVVDLQKLEIPLPIAHPAIISVLIYNRENDQDPIDMDDVTCQRVLQACQGQTYTETQGADTDTTNGDLSTPDHMTGSDAEVILSNLAEPEATAFSEDDMCMPSPVEEMQNDECYVGGDVRQVSNHDNARGVRVLYHETEADTSCVLEMADV